MAKYMTVNALSIAHPHNPKRSLLIHGGEVFEPPAEGFDVSAALQSGAIRELTDEEKANNEANEQAAAERARAEAQSSEEQQEVEAPERPSNGASREVWANYLSDLEDHFDADAGAPDDAKRDDLIRIADEFRTEQES